MKIGSDDRSRDDQIVRLFRDSFTRSEGEEEGALIAELSRDLLARTPPEDLRVYTAEEGGSLCACAIFSRLHFPDEARLVFLLSPMAVVPDHQRRGIGQAVLRHALESLRAEGVEIAVTYGDPAYYARVGFAPVSEDILPAPLPLSMPIGWIAQSLTGAPLSPLAGPSRCAPALNRPEVW